MKRLEVTKLHGSNPDVLAEEIANVRTKVNEIVDILNALEADEAVVRKEEIAAQEAAPAEEAKANPAPEPPADEIQPAEEAASEEEEK